VDEVDLFTSSNFLPRHLDMIVSLGRHRGVRFFGASRRPQDIPPLIRAQAGRIISFIQTEPRCIEWLRQVMGDAALQVRRLQRFKALEWDDSQGPGILDTYSPQG